MLSIVVAAAGLALLVNIGWPAVKIAARCPALPSICISLAKNGVRDKKAQALAEAAHAAAIEQHVAVRGEAVKADVVRELAVETLTTRERIRLLDKQLGEALEDHAGA